MSISRLIKGLIIDLAHRIVEMLEGTSDRDENDPPIAGDYGARTEQEIIRDRSAVWNYPSKKTPEQEQALTDYQAQIASSNQ